LSCSRVGSALLPVICLRINPVSASPLARLNLALELARRQTGTGAVTALNRIETEAELLKEMID
jgi:hypothetical protein